MISIVPPSFELTIDLLENKKEIQMIPKKNGVYVFSNQDQEILYIGKSTNLYRRVNEHLSGKTNTKEFHKKFRYVRYFLVDTLLDAEMYETYLINTMNPLYNIDKRFEEGSKQFVEAVKRMTAQEKRDEIIRFMSPVIEKCVRVPAKTMIHILTMNQYSIDKFTFNPKMISALEEHHIKIVGDFFVWAKEETQEVYYA